MLDAKLQKTLKGLARLLSYPDQRTIDVAELLYVILQDQVPKAATEIAEFGAWLEQHQPYEVEEAFTRTFDVNPACALEVGWHLFGEEYARGMFLVRMREELRKHDIPETTELPDHITHVLAIVAAMPSKEADRFVRACVLPAVEKMRNALSGQDTPYALPISSLMRVLVHVWADQDWQPTPPGDSHRSALPEGVDLLHAYPVADVNPGCGSGCGNLEPGKLVQLSIDAEPAGRIKP